MAGSKTDDGREKRRALLKLIREYHEERGYPPQIAELVTATGIPRTTVRWHLDSLREQGFVAFVPEALSRTLCPTGKDPRTLR